MNLNALNPLFEIQAKLDSRIESEHQLHEEDLFDRKILALLVEIGELANETRCFKFWSLKGASPESTILEEYVDGLHFLLSIGLEKDFGTFSEKDIPAVAPDNLTDWFLQLYTRIDALHTHPDRIDYEALMALFVSGADLLSFTFDQMIDAYYEKNKLNHERQEKGY